MAYTHCEQRKNHCPIKNSLGSAFDIQAFPHNNAAKLIAFISIILQINAQQ